MDHLGGMVCSGRISLFVQVNPALINNPLKQGVNKMAAKAAVSDDGALAHKPLTPAPAQQTWLP